MGLAVSVLAMVLTVPWLFFGETDGRVGGLPVWAFYSVAMSAVYAVAVAWGLGRRWKGGDDDE